MSAYPTWLTYGLVQLGLFAVGLLMATALSKDGVGDPALEAAKGF